MPPNWVRDETAGVEWWFHFRDRHSDLSLRKPHVSLARATAFNRHNVCAFFDDLRYALDHFQIRRENIWNMNETALRPSLVIPKHSTRHFRSIASAGHKVLVTLALFVSAAGHCMPPFYVFPRLRYKYHYSVTAAPESDEAANASGWMKAPQFLKFLHHFKRHARPTPENPTLLILASHESHLSITSLDFCKENGIKMLTVPPHTSHRLQPLDRSVFEPVNKLCNDACQNWLHELFNFGKSIALYHVPALSRDAINRGASISNIQNGFRVTGISPFDPNVFTDEDFLAADIADRPPDPGARPHTPEIEISAHAEVKTENDEIDNVEDDKMDWEMAAEEEDPLFLCDFIKSEVESDDESDSINIK